MKKEKDKIISYIVKILSYLSLIVLVLVSCFLIFYIASVQYSRIKNTKPLISLFTIVSPSMEPNIKIYDVIFETRVKDESELKIGDVITFNSDMLDTGGYTVTHRIYKIYEKDGIKHYITKGDNNQRQDQGSITYNNVVGKVRFKLNGLGKIQFFVSSKLGWLCIVFIPAMGIIAMDIMKIAKIISIKKELNKVETIKQASKKKQQENNKKLKATIEKVDSINNKIKK